MGWEVPLLLRSSPPPSDSGAGRTQGRPQPHQEPSQDAHQGAPVQVGPGEPAPRGSALHTGCPALTSQGQYVSCLMNPTHQIFRPTTIWRQLASTKAHAGLSKGFPKRLQTRAGGIRVPSALGASRFSRQSERCQVNSAQGNAACEPREYSPVGGGAGSCQAGTGKPDCAPGTGLDGQAGSQDTVLRNWVPGAKPGAAAKRGGCAGRS